MKEKIILYRVIQKSCAHVGRGLCVSRDCMTLGTTLLETAVPCNREFIVLNVFVFLQVHRDLWITL